MKTPIFHDTTLRDGNQSLKKPWNIDEKLTVLRLITDLGIKHVEAGFPSAGGMDFEAVDAVCRTADASCTICALTRAIEKDIAVTAEALKHAANPRIHIVLAVSPFTIEHMLKKSPMAVKEIAVASVRQARSLMKDKGQVQFTGEHFGDCVDNLDFVKEVFLACADAGADVINMPNTVERYRPHMFTRMVEEVVAVLPKNVVASVHCHNDLGMATATSVESYFAGAVQIETCLNGIGERAGNANFFETAVVLHNCGVETGLNMNLFYDTAVRIAEMSGVPIHQKAPLFGGDVVIHRSGIHQDGAVKTKGMKKGAYRPMDFSVIGRKNNDHIGFTSQSGTAAIQDILAQAGHIITPEKAREMLNRCKEASERNGELTPEQIENIYLGRA